MVTWSDAIGLQLDFIFTDKLIGSQLDLILTRENFRNLNCIMQDGGQVSRTEMSLRGYAKFSNSFVGICVLKHL